LEAKDVIRAIEEEEIGWNYSAFRRGDEIGIDLTISWDPESGNWSHPDTGKLIRAIKGIFKDTNCREAARDLQAQLADGAISWGYKL